MQWRSRQGRLTSGALVVRAGISRFATARTKIRSLPRSSLQPLKRRKWFSAVAKIHLAASMRVHPIASEFTELTQVDGSILKEPIKAIDGFLDVPNGPGFGVEIDDDALDKYRISMD